MTKSTIFLFLVLMLLLAITGCIQEMTVQERLLCIELSSYSSDSVPVCDSQEKCVKEFEKNFVFQSKELNPFIQNSLSEFKNRVSLSWLYFNKALDNVKKINNACSSQNNLSGLDVFTNELNFNLLKAFEEIEKAHETAFGIMLLEKADLELQDVNLVIEEEIFNDFIAFNEAANSLHSGNFSGKNFVSFYFENNERFSGIVSRFGFREKFVKQTTLLDAVDFFDEKLLEFVPKDSFFVPVLSSAYFKVFGFLKNSFEINRSVSFLKSVPVFELFDSFNWFAGTTSSSVKKFTEMINSSNFHRQSLEEKNLLAEKEIEELFVQAEQKILFLDDSTYSVFDKNFLSELAELSEFSATITSDKYGFSGLSGLKLESSVSFAQIKANFNDLKTQEVVSGISLGKKTRSLKEIRSNILLLSESIDFYSNNAVKGLQNACAQRILLVEDKAKNKLTEGSAVLAGLSARILFNAGEFKKQLQVAPALVLCKEIIQDFKNFQKALENSQLFETDAKSIAGTCMKNLENFFSNTSSEFFDLKKLFESLKASAPSFEVSSLVQKCVSLKEKTVASLNSLEEAEKIVSNNQETEKILASLQKISAVYPQNPAKKSFENLSKKFAAQKEFFEGKTLSLLAISVLSELENSSFSLKTEAKEALYVAVRFLLEQNVSVEIFSEKKVVAGKESSSNIKISSKNIVEQFDFPVTFSVSGIEFFSPVETFHSSNVSGFFLDKKNLLIDLNFVPLGSSVLVVEDKKIPAFITEKIFPISVSVSKAFFEKQLSIDSNGIIKELEVFTGLPENTVLADTFVFFKSEKVFFEKTTAGISFSLVDVSDKSVVSVFFYVKDPLTVEIKNTETIAVDANSFNYFFFIELKNKLDFELKNMKIFVPVPVSESDFSVKKTTSSDGQKIGFEKHSLGNILLSIESFAPQEKKELLLEISVKNYSFFWQDFVKNLEDMLSILLKSGDKSVLENAKKILEKLDLVNQSADFENNEFIQEIFELSLQTQRLFEQNESFEKSIAIVSGLKEELLAEIFLLEQNALFLKESGFESDSKKLFSMASKTRSLVENVNESLPLVAAEALLSIKSSLTERQKFSVSDFLTEKTEKLVKQANDLFSLEKDFKVVFAGKEKVFDAQKNVLFYLNNKDFEMTGRFLKELEKTVELMEMQALEKAQKILEEKKALFEEFGLLALGIPQKARDLKDLQKSFLEKLPGYFFPTSVERIEKLLLKFNSFLLSSVQDSLNEVLGLEEDKNALQAAKNALLVSKEAEKYLEELRKIDKEFSSDILAVKEDAFSAFHIVELKAKNAGNLEASALLLEAKQKLERQDFVQAIFLSEKASGLLDKGKANGFEIPIAVYPVFFLLAAGMFFKFAKKKPAMVQKIKIEKAKIET